MCYTNGLLNTITTYSEESMTLDVLQGGTNVGVCHKNCIQQVLLKLVQERSILRLAGQNLVIDVLWVTVTEWSDSNKIYFA